MSIFTAAGFRCRLRVAGTVTCKFVRIRAILRKKEDVPMKKKDLLLIIDMQNVYTAGQDWACCRIRQAADSILRLLSSGAFEDVIFTRFLASQSPSGVWKEYNRVNEAINRDPWKNEMMPEFAPFLERYPLFTKSVYSSFAIPEVQKAARSADRVAVAGVVAECCVLSTVLAGVDAGIPILYLKDAVSGLTPESERAVQDILSGFEPLHVRILSVSDYLSGRGGAR